MFLLEIFVLTTTMLVHRGTEADFVLDGRVFLGPAESDTKPCGAGEVCISLDRCRRLKKSKDTHRVRDHTCASHNGTVKVCCKSVFEIGLERRLTKCGRQPIGEQFPGRGKVSPFGSYPWVVLLKYEDVQTHEFMFRCSGSLLNSRYILTAGHCVDRIKLHNYKLTDVHIGEGNLSRSAPAEHCLDLGGFVQCFRRIVASPQKIVLHPHYNSTTQDADIALIKLNVTLDFEDRSALIEPVCLPPQDFNWTSIIGLRSIVTSWNNKEDENNYDNLHQQRSVVINLVDQLQCLIKFSSKYYNEQICAVGDHGRDTCNGDSGAAVVLPSDEGPPFTQIGILSFGKSPCYTKEPSVYTFVGDYRDWIIDNAQP